MHDEVDVKEEIAPPIRYPIPKNIKRIPINAISTANPFGTLFFSSHNIG